MVKITIHSDQLKCMPAMAGILETESKKIDPFNIGLEMNPEIQKPKIEEVLWHFRAKDIAYSDKSIKSIVGVISFESRFLQVSNSSLELLRSYFF